MASRVDYSSWVGVKKGMMTVTEVVGKVAGDVLLGGVCDCGKYKTFRYSNFRMGRQLSCGCNRTPKVVSYDYKHPLYKIWIAMRARCDNETDQYYYNYGGRGVKVCEEWDNSYEVFYNWCIANGWRKGLFVDKDVIPKKMGIPALLYSPEMCSIVTRTENNQSSRAAKLDMQKARDIRASNLPIKELAKMYGVLPCAIYAIRRNKTWKE